MQGGTLNCLRGVLPKHSALNFDRQRFSGMWSVKSKATDLSSSQQRQKNYPSPLLMNRDPNNPNFTSSTSHRILIEQIVTMALVL